MKLYNSTTIQNLIDLYCVEYGGEMCEIEEGCLGHGKLILTQAEGKKSIVITEVPISEWSSMHRIRKYNTLPKKYEQYLN